MSALKLSTAATLHYQLNSVDNTKLPSYTLPQCSAKVSLETYPL